MQYLDRGNVLSGSQFLCPPYIEWVSIFHYIKGSKQPWDSQYSNGAS